MRNNSPLRWSLSNPRSRDKFEAVIYLANDGVHLDFIKHGLKKTCVVTLHEEAARTWCFLKDNIQNAVCTRTKYEYELDEQLKLAHEEFRGSWYVVLRQWHRDDKGDLKPGRYGLNMNIDVWTRYFTDKAGEIGKFV